MVAVAEAHGRLDLAGAALDRVDGRHRSLAMRLLAYEARATRHVLAGRRAQAVRTISSGRRLLVHHRALFEATELRAQASSWGAGLAALETRLAWDERPAALLAATERWRATTVLEPSGRLGDDDDLATLLARYRAVHARAAEAERDGCPGDESARDLRDAERAVTAALRVRSRARTEVDQEPSWPATRRSLGDRRLVELVEHGGMMRALVVSPRRVDSVDLGSAAAIVAKAATATRALRQLAPVASLPAGALVARTAFAALASLRVAVVAPLEPLLGSCLEVVVVPSGPLFALPWVYLFGRERVVSVVPSARHWLRAGRQLDDGRAQTLVVAGPDLPGANHEAHRVAAVHRSSVVLCGREATAARFLHEAEMAGLAHVAAHARFRSRNPLFSHVLLADGPLTAHDLDRLRRPPRIVVLSACSSGAVSSPRRRGAARPLDRAPVRRVRRPRRHDAAGSRWRHRPVARRPAPRAGRRAVARRGRGAQRDGGRRGYPCRPAAGLCAGLLRSVRRHAPDGSSSTNHGVTISSAPGWVRIVSRVVSARAPVMRNWPDPSVSTMSSSGGCSARTW